MSTVDSRSCPHGHKAPEKVREDIGPEWVQRFAPDCVLCNGAPAGIAYRDGPSQKASS